MRWLVVVAAVLVGLAGTGPAVAQVCNHKDGNTIDCVNYNAVGYGEISVCNLAENIDPQAVQHAIDAWNDMIGKPLFTAGCPPYTGITIVDREDGDCAYAEDGRPNPACADVPTQEAPVLLFVKVVPSLATYTLHDQEHVAVHEVGHTLGFWHWAACTSPMSLCYDFTEPTGVDLNNYLNAYWVEAVTSLTGSSPSPATVSLSWSTVNPLGQQLCNEKEFGVWRLNPSTGSYDTHVATAGQNGTGSVFAGQPSGEESYRVWSMTDALSSPFAGYAPPVAVDVRGPRVTSLFLFGPSPSTLSDEQGRYMWAIGTVYNPETVAQEVRIRADATGHPSGCSQLEQLVLPGEEQFWLSAGEEKWVLYRFRYESHSPAPRGVYSMPVQLCVRYAGQDFDAHCRSHIRQLIVQ